jgi:hypothetical protein
MTPEGGIGQGGRRQVLNPQVAVGDDIGVVVKQERAIQGIAVTNNTQAKDQEDYPQVKPARFRRHGSFLCVKAAATAGKMGWV